MIAVRVIIGDDEPLYRAALVDLVNGEPLLELVGAAQNADEAIDVARQERPTVALLDVHMPGGGGPRATREILAVSPETKVLALSATGDRDGVFGMLRAGAIGYLLKDDSPENIVRAISQAASGQAILSRGVTAEVIQELVTQLNRSDVLSGELEALDRTKSELVQILSHELRTPVTVIQAAATTLAKPRLDLSSEQAADVLAVVMRATSKLSRMAGNVSAAAGLGREDAEIPTRELSVDQLLAKVSAEFPEQRDSLSFPAEGEEPAAVSANLDLAARALVLVIENALQLSPQGEAVEVRVRAKSDKVQIRISDRGPGIPEELREQIFEPFSQVDASSTRTHQGLGIGLHLARRIMKAHGGTIGAFPREGGGSSFVIAFPAHRSSGKRRGR